MKLIFFQYQILEACLFSFHSSLFVERISELLPKCIIILTGQMEVCGYKRKFLHFSKSHHSFLSKTHRTVLMGTLPSWAATVTQGLTLFNRSSLALETNTDMDSGPCAGHHPQKVKQTEPLGVCNLSQRISIPTRKSASRGRFNSTKTCQQSRNYLVCLEPFLSHSQGPGVLKSILFFPSVKQKKTAERIFQMHSFLM